MAISPPNLEESVWKRAASIAWKGEIWKVVTKRLLGVAVGLVIAYKVADQGSRDSFLGEIATASWGVAAYAVTEATLFVYYVARAAILQRNELRTWVRERETGPVAEAIRELRKFTLRFGEFQTDALEVFKMNALLLPDGMDTETLAFSVARLAETTVADLRGKLLLRKATHRGPSIPFLSPTPTQMEEYVHEEIRSWVGHLVVGSWGASGVVTSTILETPTGRKRFYVLTELGSNVWLRVREGENPLPAKRLVRL